MPRHKQPLEVAELKGADRKNPQRYPTAPPKSQLPLGIAPDWLSDAAQAIWFEVETYAPPSVLTGADRMMLATLCELLDEFRAGPRKMSAARIGQMIGLLGRMGMSPADRQRLGTPKAPEANPFNEF